MILDSRTTLCENASVVAAAGSITLIGNQYDTGTAGTFETTDSFGLIILVSQPITATAAGKLRFQIASGATAAIATDGSAPVAMQTGDFNIGTTAIPAGTCLYAGEIGRNSGVFQNNQRFLGLLEVVTTTGVAAGAISAFLCLDYGRWTANTQVVN